MFTGAVCLASGLSNKAFADELNINRDDFGQSDTGLWSPLSVFESTTLQQIAQAQAGDADALLAFYILAAGSHRDARSFADMQAHIDTFLANIEAPLKRKRKVIDKAKFIHDAMHEEFFLADTDGNTLVGYQAEQSQLPEIFNSREFNCISSSLLYLVLARKQGIAISGVLLPSHAFVQIYDDKNRVIEIETTSVAGFGLEHNEEFYQHEDLTWFEQRNLEPTTYDDYLQRQILSPYELGLHNMWSQHTSAERMGYQDRMRLAEIRGMLQPQDIDAQKNRLNFYLQELSYLNREQDTINAFRLTELITDRVSEMTNFAQQDTTLQSLWFNLQTEIALAHIQSGQLSQGFELAKYLLEEIQLQALNETHYRDNLFVVIAHYIIQGTQRYDFAQLRLSLLELEDDCVGSEACSQSLTQLYANWAEQFWNQQDWRNASRILTEFTQFGIESQNSEILRANAELAYVNLAKESLYDEDWETAIVQLQECVDLLPSEQRCSQQIKYINEQVHLGNI